MQLTRLFKAAAVTIVLIIVLVLGVQVALNVHFNKWIKTKLQATVNDEKLYLLNIGELSINIFSRNIVIKESSFEPAMPVKDAARYIIKVKRIKLKRAGITDYLFRDKLQVDEIEFGGADISIYQGKKVFESDTMSSLYDVIKKDFTSLIAGKVTVSNASINIFRNGNDSSAFLSLPDNTIEIRNFIIDERAASEKRLFRSDSFNLQLQNIKWKTEDGFYKVEAPMIFASYMDSLVRIDSLSFLPADPSTFFRKKKHQTDMFSVRIKQIEMNGANVKQLIETGSVDARTFSVDGLNLEAYRDKNYDRKQAVMPSLQEVLRSLPVSINIPDIRISHATVKYSEMIKDGRKAGNVSFTDLNATITGLNASGLKDGRGELEIKADADLMGTGQMKTTLSFPWSADKTLFYCSGSLGKMNMKVLNRIIEPNVSVSVKDGTIQSMEFRFKADHNYAEGNLRLLYDNLKVELLSSNGMENDPVKGIITFVANLAVIHSSNPEGDRPERKGKIVYVRDPQRFVFNYSWKAIFSGIEDIIKRSYKQ